MKNDRFHNHTKMHETLTKSNINKGFSGNLNIRPRSNFGFVEQ
jgi:hypothetical protein